MFHLTRFGNIFIILNISHIMINSKQFFCPDLPGYMAKDLGSEGEGENG